MNLSFASHEEYCKYFDATYIKNDDGGGNDADSSIGAEGPNATQKIMERARGKERSRPVKNKMLASHWPPENAGELHLNRW